MRAYRIELAPGECSGELRYGFSGLSVALSEGNLGLHDAGGATRTLASAPGDVVWHGGPLSFELTNRGREEARLAGRMIRQIGLQSITHVYASVLKRAIKTAWLMLDELELESLEEDDELPGALLSLPA